jgi:uncharacterized integral membrane protein (TIGR00698 family)
MISGTTMRSRIDMYTAMERTRLWAPGVALATLITLVALALGRIQEMLFDFAALEPLVLALLIGLAVRAAWTPRAVFLPGIGISAKQLLEFAIVLLGASLNLAAIVDAGMQLLAAVLISVSVTLVAGIVLGRAAGLGPRLAILVAVGNAICGNSAIAAVAPVIRARKQEVASAIALTAVLGVGVVLALPLLVGVFDLTDERYGVVAGLTVYAVPQVLAATIPVSAEAGQIASLVKLTRVLLLGPVVALFAMLYRNRDEEGASSASRRSLGTFLPWFVIGFAAMSLLRTASLLPDQVAEVAREASKLLTSVAMAGLGMSVDLRSIRASGMRVGLVVIALTILLVAMALTIVTTMGIG